MKNITIPILVAVIFLVLATYLVAFQVRQNELAFVTRFGEPVRSITKPGLKFRLPTPIERVHKFDSRMRLLEAEISETTTRGRVPIIVNTYVVWRITDPLQFYNSVGSVEGAESKLRSQINDTQNRVIGQYTFAEFINSDPNQIKFDEIQSKMLADLGPRVARDYGVEVETLGIKQLKISQDTTKEVFERMKAERKRRTDTTIALGTAEATTIRTEAAAIRTGLLAAAEGRAKAIQGQGDAETAKYLEKMEQDPELAMFLRNLDSLRTTLRDHATLVLPADCEPFSLLKGRPSLKASGQK
ncbi:MAG: protease modulator HflC [Sedimentisphaerales bacterium]|nr:protease modulator HflC [Sedimentisphaerales bacterium]